MNELERQVAELKRLGATPREIQEYIKEHSPSFTGQGTSRTWDDPKPSKLEGVARAANQGISFGTSDEISAGIGAGIDKIRGEPFGKSYRARVAGERQADREFKSAHPVLGYGAEIAGGIANAGAIPGLVRMGAVKGGLVAGAAYGAGASEGGIEERLKGAGVGGAVGGVGGAALQGLARAAVPVGRKIAENISLESRLGKALTSRSVDVGARQTASAAERDILKQIERGGMTLEQVLESAKTAHPDARLLDIAGDPMLRRARGVHAIPSKGSADIHAALTERVQGQPGRVQSGVARAITGRSRENAVVAADELARQRSAQAGPLYADAFKHGAVDDDAIAEMLKLPYFQRAWEQAQRLGELDGIKLPQIYKRVPNPALERAAGRAQTVRDEAGRIRRNLGGVTDDELSREYARLAEINAKEEAFHAGVKESGYRADFEELPRTERLGKRGQEDLPDADGMIDAERLAADNQIVKDYNRSQIVRQARERAMARIEAELTARGDMLDDAGELPSHVMELVRVPDVRSLHYLKLGLDDVIEKGMSAPLERGGFTPTMAGKVKAKQSELLGKLDSHAPAYKTARNAYAGASKVMEAHDAGRRFVNTSSDELAATWGSLSPSEQEFYRRGALSEISVQLAKVTDGRDVTRIFQNPLMREKLGIILPDERAAQQFLADLAEETRLHKNSQTVLGGSPTARIEAEKGDDMAGQIATGFVDTMTGNARGAAVSALRRFVGPQEVRGLTEAKADALAPMLTARGPQIRQMLEQASQRQAKGKAATSRRASRLSPLIRPLALGSGQGGQ